MHALHAVAPSTSWNVPAAHFKHASCAGWLLYVPAEQLVAASDPTEHEVPTGHDTHWSTLDMTGNERFLWVPPGHGSGAAAPSSQ